MGEMIRFSCERPLCKAVRIPKGVANGSSAPCGRPMRRSRPRATGPHPGGNRRPGGKDCKRYPKWAYRGMFDRFEHLY